MTIRYHSLSLVTLLLVLLVLPQHTWAQSVVVTDLSPPVIPLSQQTLTMVSLTNTGSAPVQGYVQTELLDVNLASVVSLRSAEFVLSPGQQLSPAGISYLPSVVYGSSPSAAVLSGQGQLYSGDYVVCHVVVTTAGQELVQECFEKRAQLNINFSLIHPANGAVLSNLHPLLNWENVAQFGLTTGGISYELTVVEKRAGQSVAEALDLGIPLLRRSALSTASLPYPAGSPPLVPGRTYAWLVRVIQNGQEILISEPWTFTVATSEGMVIREQPSSYAMATVERGNRTYQFAETIFLGFDNTEGVRQLTYTLKDLQTYATIAGSNTHLSNLRPGLNTIDISTANLGLEAGHTYRLTVHTPHRRKYFLQFRYETP